MRRIAILILICMLPAVYAQTIDDIKNASANQWIEVSNTRMDAEDPCPAHNCSYSAVEGISAVMDDWCGGVFDTKRNRLVVWGGGHNGYFGNELYVFDVDDMKWTRITDPSTSVNLGGQVNPDGTPNSRHTYNGLEYLIHADRFFACGGALALPAGSCGADKVWTFNFDTKQWKDMKPAGTGPVTQCGDLCAYDPNTNKVWYFDANYWDGSRWGLYSYDYDSNQWTKHGNQHHYNVTCVVDPKRNLLLVVGDDKVYCYDIGKGVYTRQEWTTTGGGGFISGSSVGLAYDPVADKIVGWNGGAVYVLDPDTKVWTANNPGSGPTRNVNNTYGRWRYVPSVNAYISANQVDKNVYFYKLTANMGTETKINPAKCTSLIHVSPNPFNRTALITVNGNSSKAAIYDINGRLVYCLNFADKFTWHAEHHPPGLYFLKVMIGNRINVKRLLLQK